MALLQVHLTHVGSPWAGNLWQVRHNTGDSLSAPCPEGEQTEIPEQFKPVVEIDFYRGSGADSCTLPVSAACSETKRRRLFHGKQKPGVRLSSHERAHALRERCAVAAETRCGAGNFLEFRVIDSETLVRAR